MKKIKEIMEYQMMLAIGIAIIMMIGILSIFILGNDNAVEETCEADVKMMSGQDIDLSPLSPEDKSSK